MFCLVGDSTSSPIGWRWRYWRWRGGERAFEECAMGLFSLLMKETLLPRIGAWPGLLRCAVCTILSSSSHQQLHQEMFSIF
jgi:hypothetical protein